MKKKIFIVVICILVTLSAFSPQVSYAQENQAQTDVSAESSDETITEFEKASYNRYAKKKISLYKSADTSAKKISIKKSTQVKVTGIRSDGWSKVTYKKKTYYCKTNNLAKTNGYTIVIDAGHQKKANTSQEPLGPGASIKKAKVTGGAIGVSTKTAEYKLTLKVSKQLKKELQNRGYKVVMTRTKNNVNLSNSARAKIGNTAKADAVIHIHANSYDYSGLNGALTISPSKNNKYCKKIYSKSNRLSKSVLKEFCKSTKAKNLGVTYDDTMSGINYSKVPVTILEMGFLSNPKEDKKMSTASYQKKMVKGIANGIDKYLKR